MENFFMYLYEESYSTFLWQGDVESKIREEKKGVDKISEITFPEGQKFEAISQNHMWVRGQKQWNC